MKNLFKKLALFTLASIILSNFVIPSFVANANGACDATVIPALEEALKCIVLEGNTPNDKDKIIKIVEEPLSTNPSSFGTGTGTEEDKEFEARPCLRISATCKDSNVGFITKSALIKGSTPPNGVKCGQTGGDGVWNIYCKEVMVLLSKGGPTMIMGFISMIYKWAASIVGLIAVLVIVISGIQISASGGNSSAVDGAKGRIINSIAGLALLFLSGIILYTINPNFFTAQ